MTSKGCPATIRSIRPGTPGASVSPRAISWTDAPQANVEAYAVPNTDAAGLLASLERLWTVVAEP